MTDEDGDRAYADPAGAGFADPALVAGRPRSAYVHLGALVLAAGADVGAFYQIVSRVLADAPGVLVALVVLGFTATVLYLAHVTGILLRNVRAGERSTSAWGVPVCLLVIGALGTVAYVVRLRVPSSARPPRTSISAAAGPAAPAATGPDLQFYGALLFLSLYVATVLVAAAGAYLTHNPRREGYVMAVRMYDRWAERAGVAQAAHLAEAGREAQERDNVAQAEHVLAAQIRRVLAVAEELKQTTRARYAATSKDPADTDAWLADDARPYVYPRHDTSTNGHRET